MAKVLYVVRHGQTEWNVQQRMQGRLDSPLTETGQQQAMTHGRLLQELGGVDQLLVSPSGRTQETAYLLNSFLGATITFDEVLMERDCGAWSGLTLDQIKEQFPRDWEARQRDPFAHRPPGGENVPDLVDRVAGLLESALDNPAERIALVTHGVMSRAVLSCLLALEPTMAGRVRHPNSALYRLQVGGGQTVASHFLNGDGPHPGLLHDPISAAADGQTKSE